MDRLDSLFYIIIFFFFCLVIISCGNSEDYTIKRYPTFKKIVLTEIEISRHKDLVLTRKSRLKKFYKRLEVGVSSGNVLNILGEPDVMHIVQKLNQEKSTVSKSFFYSMATDINNSQDIMKQGIVIYFDSSDLLVWSEVKNVTGFEQIGAINTELFHVKY